MILLYKEVNTMLDHKQNPFYYNLEINLNGFYYSVKYGESVFSISQTFNVTMEDIIVTNRLSPPYIIYPGQRLFIPYPTHTPPGIGRIYIVQPGDTLFTLAQIFNTSVERIVEINNISDPNLIYPGQRLIISS